MVFGWLKQRRRRHLLAQTWPKAWESALRENVWQYHYLDDDSPTAGA